MPFYLSEGNNTEASLKKTCWQLCYKMQLYVQRQIQRCVCGCVSRIWDADQAPQTIIKLYEKYRSPIRDQLKCLYAYGSNALLLFEDLLPFLLLDVLMRAMRVWGTCACAHVCVAIWTCMRRTQDKSWLSFSGICHHFFLFYSETGFLFGLHLTEQARPADACKLTPGIFLFLPSILGFKCVPQCQPFYVGARKKLNYLNGPCPLF